jgi:hypothetical protein
MPSEIVAYPKGSEALWLDLSRNGSQRYYRAVPMRDPSAFVRTNCEPPQHIERTVH